MNGIIPDVGCITNVLVELGIYIKKTRTKYGKKSDFRRLSLHNWDNVTRDQVDKCR